MAFIIWLLCVLENTLLWMVFLIFLLFGHTHDKLDRFFGRMMGALRGRTYLTEEQMWEIICGAT